MKVATLQRDGFTWNRGMISNIGAWSLIDPDGFLVAHVYQCDNRTTWCAVDNEGTVILESASTCGEALRAADEAMRPWVDPHPTFGIVGCDKERRHGSVYCTKHESRAAVLDGWTNANFEGNGR